MNDLSIGNMNEKIEINQNELIKFLYSTNADKSNKSNAERINQTIIKYIPSLQVLIFIL